MLQLSASCKIIIAALAGAGAICVTAHAQTPPIACAFDQLSEGEQQALGKTILDAVMKNTGPRAYEKAILARVEKCPRFRIMTNRQLTLAEEYTEYRLLYLATKPGLSEIRDSSVLPDALWARYSAEERRAMFEIYGDPATFQRRPISTFWTQPGPVRDRLFAAITVHPLSPDEGLLVMFGLAGLAGQAATEKAW